MLKEQAQRARKAFETWSSMPLQKRAEMLLAFAKKVEERQEAFATCISKEMGKPLWEAKKEVQLVQDKVQISLDAFKLRCPENRRELSSARSITRHKPHGVAAVIGPYNFPAHLPNSHIIPALLAGNTILFKPSELTPKTGEFYTHLWNEVGLPPGVIELIQGGRDVGEALLKEDINAVFFTGSVPVGLKILKHFSERPDVIVALEMGGNNPLIVSDIKDIHAASYATIQSAFITSGQRCTCARRLIVLEGSIGDAFLKELVHMIESVRVGRWDEKPDPFMGALPNAEIAGKIFKCYSELIKKGAEPLYEMKSLAEDMLCPGIIDVTAIKSLIPDEEIFGPLLQVIRVNNFKEAIDEANRTKYGLSAGLFSNSYEEYEHFFQKIRAGIINWNAPLTGASSHAPFGGVGFSGNGRPSALYAADYVAFPVASVEGESLKIPTVLIPGIQGVKK